MFPAPTRDKLVEQNNPVPVSEVMAVVVTHRYRPVAVRHTIVEHTDLTPNYDQDPCNTNDRQSSRYTGDERPEQTERKCEQRHSTRGIRSLGSVECRGRK